jgi:hypothetical protein
VEHGQADASERRLEKRDALLWHQKQDNCFLSLLAHAASCSLGFPQLLRTVAPLAICCSLGKPVQILILFYVYLCVPDEEKKSYPL